MLHCPCVVAKLQSHSNTWCIGLKSAAIAADPDTFKLSAAAGFYVLVSTVKPLPVSS